MAVGATYQQPETLVGRKVARIAWAVFGLTALASQRFDPEALTAAAQDWIAFTDVVSVAKVMKWLKTHVDEERIKQGQDHVGLAEVAAGGVGIVALPLFIGACIPGLAQLTPPLPELEGELWLLTHPDLRNTARGRAFLGLLRGRDRQAPRGDRGKRMTERLGA